MGLLKMDVDFERRIFGLDLMRCIAILVVLFGHVWVFFEKWLYAVIPGTDTAVQVPLFNFINGFDGVDIFFVLSGFLIGTIILKLYDKNESFTIPIIWNFWKRRWLRTVPAYFVFLSINVILALSLDKAYNFDISYYVFLQNFTEGGLTFFAESWSLSIEEWFYLTLPTSLLLWGWISSKMKSKKTRFFLFIILYMITTTALRFHRGLNGENLLLNDDIRTVVLMRLDTIGFGVIMAWAKFYDLKLWTNYKNLLVVLGSLILIANFYFGVIEKIEIFRNTVYYSFVGFGMCLFIPKAFDLKMKDGLLKKFIVVTSLTSYSMYLINYSILLMLFKKFMLIETLWAGIGFSLLFLLTLYVLSILSYKYIEQPFIRYRDRVTIKDSVVKE